MSHIDIGNVVSGDHAGKMAAVDLALLLRGRGLVQASSGGGKSYFLRRLAEQACKHVPVWIVDPEGEMSTLRDKYPFYMVGKGGDTPADLRTVETVVQALRRHRANVIFDLFELKPEIRHRYVRMLCEALTESPKDLWTELLFLLDEAHSFAPEKGMGESEAYGAVVDIACRGRKRGISLVAFDQRLAKLSKNVTAELTNRMFGRTTEGNDVKRALEELSIPREERDAMKLKIRRLKPGEFFCTGPAISDEIVQVKVGRVETRHPEAGHAAPAAPPPPPAKLHALLAKLGDLPREAEERATTTAALQAEIRSLRAQLAARPTTVTAAAPAPKPVVTKVTVQRDVPVLGKRASNKIEKAAKQAMDASSYLYVVATKLEEALKKIESQGAVKVNEKKAPLGLARYTETVASVKPVAQRSPFPHMKLMDDVTKAVDAQLPSGAIVLSKVEKAILSVLTRYPEGCQKGKLTLLTGYTYSGTFQNALSKLRTSGCITGSNNEVMKITTLGMSCMDDSNPLPQGGSLVAYWANFPHFSGIAKKALRVILEHPGEYTAREAAEAAGYTYSGTFQNGMSELRTAGVIVGKNSEKLRLCDELMQAQQEVPF